MKYVILNEMNNYYLRVLIIISYYFATATCIAAAIDIHTSKHLLVASYVAATALADVRTINNILTQLLVLRLQKPLLS